MGNTSNADEAMGKMILAAVARIPCLWCAVARSCSMLNTRWVRSSMASRCLLSLSLSCSSSIFIQYIYARFSVFYFYFHSAKVTCQINLIFIVNIRFVSCRIEMLLWIGCTVNTKYRVVHARNFSFFFSEGNRIAYAQLVRISRQLIVVLLFAHNVFSFRSFHTIFFHSRWRSFFSFASFAQYHSFAAFLVFCFLRAHCAQHFIYRTLHVS